MRIITAANAKDYFDRYSNPTDNDLIWVRKQQFIPVAEREVAPLRQFLTMPRGLRPIPHEDKAHKVLGPTDPVLETGKSMGSVDFRIRDEDEEWRVTGKHRYDGVFVVFCGRLYRGIRFCERWPTDLYEYQERYRIYWSHEEFAAEHEQEDVKKSFSLRANIAVEKWFARNQGLTVKSEEFKKMEVSDVCIDLNSPILVYGINGQQRGWVKDGLVKDLQFYKLFDTPQAAFQELEMFVGGVMVRRDPIAKVPDKLKVAAHGMDERSFRRDPTKNH